MASGEGQPTEMSALVCRTLCRYVYTYIHGIHRFMTNFNIVFLIDRAIVVCAGLAYGGREDILYYWFQKAWECEPSLPIFGRGSNTVPLINVFDFAQ